jgi:hypothetical protein
MTFEDRAIAELLRDAEESYGQGRTSNPGEAGYVLPDGSLLAMGRDGDRGSDHRAIIGALWELQEEAGFPAHDDGARTLTMRFWMARLRLVRMGFYGQARRGFVLDLEAASPLTVEQRATVRGLLRQVDYAEVRRVLRGETEDSLELDPPTAMTIGQAMALLIRPDTEAPQQVGRSLPDALQPQPRRSR